MRSSYVAANMALPALKSEALGQRLQSLHGDEGPLLAEILRELAQEVEREPRNLIASTAYGHALVLAGRGAEARREARRGFELWRSLPAVSPAATLNVVAGLADAGLVTEAKQALGSLDGRLLGERDERLRAEHALQIGVRFGEVEWWAARSRDAILPFLSQAGLAMHWRAIASAIEAALGARIVRLDAALEGLDDAKQLVLQYWTDSLSYAELSRLQDEAWDAVDRAVAAGAADPTGRVVFMIYGPVVPIEEIGP